MEIWESVQNGALDFSIDSDGQIAFDGTPDYHVTVDVLQIGKGFIERIHAMEPLHDGFVASKSDLLLQRAVTVVDCGGDGDALDFIWLLSEVAKQECGQFPGIDDGELGCLVAAVEACLGEVSRFVVAGIIGGSNAAAAMQLLGI